MGRRFTAASSEVITIGTTAALAGLSWTFGTMAAVIYRSSDTGNWETLITTNAAAMEWDINNGDLLALWDGTNERTGMTVPTATRLLLAVTKATGTATARFHMYRFDTNAWTHSNASGTSAVAPATTSMAIGLTGGDKLDAEIWALGMWQGLVMTDSEIERLARGRWLETNPDFYEQWTDGREIGDMVRTLGRKPARQTARTGTTRGAIAPPPGFRFGPVRRRR